MVQLMRSGTLLGGSEATPSQERVPVKSEIEDSLEEEHGSFSKRPKHSSTTFQQQWSSVTNAFQIPPSQYNPLDEPSPLGLRLRKSPSLLDLIEMRLSQGNASTFGAVRGDNVKSGDNKKDLKSVMASGDKLKASNFPASLLRIGSWEYVSRYEGDLVAKCYFAKHKIVWEVLEGGLKSKIEIQWSDIMGLKGNCPENGPGTLNVVLARQPLFFRETNPQPRKHTLWQATGDFTDGQASTHREHFLQCPQGLLKKHFEKLVQCDMRLNFLSQQPELVLDSPYFEPQASIFEGPDNTKPCCFGELEGAGEGSAISGFRDSASSPATQSSSLKIELQDPVNGMVEHLSQEAPSPSSVMDACAIEGKGSSKVDEMKRPWNWEQLKVPGLHASMSMSDFMNHIGHCISEQMTSGDLPDEGLESRNILEDIAQQLFSETQFTTTSDEKSLMSRVNSLCCLLQKDPATVQNMQVGGGSVFEGSDEGKNDLKCPAEPIFENKSRDEVVVLDGDSKDFSGCKPAPAMSRKDSFGELLLHLPRIASLPKFLFNISEDGESRAR